MATGTSRHWLTKGRETALIDKDGLLPWDLPIVSFDSIISAEEYGRWETEKRP